MGQAHASIFELKRLAGESIVAIVESVVLALVSEKIRIVPQRSVNADYRTLDKAVCVTLARIIDIKNEIGKIVWFNAVILAFAVGF